MFHPPVLIQWSTSHIHIKSLINQNTVELTTSRKGLTNSPKKETLSYTGK